LTAALGAGLLGYRLARTMRGRGRRVPRRALVRRPNTQATIALQPADIDLGEPGRNIDRRLDEGLRETFPASDPVSVSVE
jgi:hypothetical protein